MAERIEGEKMEVIPSKLKKQKMTGHKCLVHKYRRFSKKNKTYRTDCYYCATCGNRRLIVDIYGSETRCWGCEGIFNMKAGDTKLFPKCDDCLGKGKVPNPEYKNRIEPSTNWMDEQTDKESVFDEMLDELGLK